MIPRTSQSSSARPPQQNAPTASSAPDSVTRSPLFCNVVINFPAGSTPPQYLNIQIHQPVLYRMLAQPGRPPSPPPVDGADVGAVQACCTELLTLVNENQGLNKIYEELLVDHCTRETSQRLSRANAQQLKTRLNVLLSQEEITEDVFLQRCSLVLKQISQIWKTRFPALWPSTQRQTSAPSQRRVAWIARVMLGDEQVKNIRNFVKNLKSARILLKKLSEIPDAETQTEMNFSSLPLPKRSAENTSSSSEKRPKTEDQNTAEKEG